LRKVGYEKPSRFLLAATLLVGHVSQFEIETRGYSRFV